MNGLGIMSRKCKKLQELSELMEANKEVINFEELSTRGLKELAEKFDTTTDERYQPNVLHRIGDIIMIVVLAVLANSDEWEKIEIFAIKKEKWLKKFLKLKNGMPSIDTIKRVMTILKAEELYKICITYFIDKIDRIIPRKFTDVDVVSIDGKTTNGSSRVKTDKNKIRALNTMSAYSTMYGISLGHEYIKEKSNEIPTGPELIKKLDLRNCIITWDALNTQIETVKAVGKETEYVGALKGNQHKFYNEIKEYMDAIEIEKEAKVESQYLKVIEKEHNGIMVREYYLTDDICWFEDRDKWNRLMSVGKEVKTIEKKDGQKTIETRYFITSLYKDIQMFAYAVRSHWGVENSLHAPLDIVFKEDKNKTLETHGAKALGVIRRICLIILKLVQPYYKESLSKIRYKLSLDYENEIEKIFKLLDTETLKAQLSSVK